MKILKFFEKVLLLTIGALIYAAGIALFLDPNSLAPGGLSGIAILISHVTPVQTGTIILLFNIPLFILSSRKFGIGFLFSTIYATALSSFAMNMAQRFLPSIVPLTDDKILAAVAGGAVMSLGMGIVYRCGGSTGGMDIIVKTLRRKFRHIKTGTMMVILDSIVVIASGIVFKNIESALYAGIALTISSIVLDIVLYGRDSAKLVYIITDYPDEISKRIMDLHIGVTFLEGEGAYSCTKKQVLMCVAKKHLYPKVKDIVKEEDTAAFMIVSGASEIFGIGFKNPYRDEI